MCGRFGFNLTDKDLEDEFGIPPLPRGAPEPDYNIAPDPTGMRPVLAVLREDASMRGPRVLAGLAWGLVPAWSRDPRRYFVNARSETAFDKPSFRHAMRYRRCVVPAGVYYEWQKAAKRGAPKVPFAFTLQGGAPFGLAAIWEHNENAGTGLAVLTTSPNELAAPVHDRMPVLLTGRSIHRWLDPEAEREALEALLRPYPAAKMRAWAVSRAVNDPTRHDADLLRPAEAHKGLPG